MEHEIITDRQLDEIVAAQKAAGVKIYCSYCALVRDVLIETDHPMNHTLEHFGWWHRNVSCRVPWRLRYVWYRLRDLDIQGAWFWASYGDRR